MKMSTLRATGLGVLVLLASAVFGHGLIQDPPSRNWICGFITKPDHVQNGTAQYPVCGNAFFAPGTNQTDGYSFMSVLTHTTGREGVGPRDNVCSFNSESFPGRVVPWDVPIDWPTQPMTAGPRNFVWSISWGPHFSDTSDFKYWITRPGFVWQTGRALSFSDFEDAPFCSLPYNDATPNANPNVIRDVPNALFTTRCTVPSRSGHHVIYAEWGRTPPTFERFHGCIDAQFSGTPPPTITASIVLNPNVTTFTGPGSITLDGRGSTGSNLTYSWSVSAPNTALYSITNSTSPVATLNLNTPTAAQDVTVNLLITSGNSTDTETRSFLHQPVANTTWQDLGALTADPRTLVVGDRVSVRTVSSTGQDAFWPTTPITITSANTGATQWPVTLGNAVNAMNGAVRVGVLNTSNNTIAPAANATSNRVFAMTSANIQSAFLQLVPGAVPNAPTGVAGTAGNAQVALTWTAVSGATSYNVKRSLTSGGPYANVQTGVAATSFTNTGLTNGTPYYYVVTAVNASGESAISNQAGPLTPSAGGGTGGASATGAVASASPWFNELQVRLANTQTITSMTVTVTVARTAGTSFSGQYNTVGGQITQSSASTTSTITYTWTLNAGQQLGASTSRTFAAQFGGNGTAHPVTGDRWTVSYATSGGATQNLSGAF
ncbi:MAG TPA: lytic polysaccharide monooxygenase [Steroidobacteraceae bacterium]|jgi:chitin-binding protein|nr:lytic polysaccharide monooxygenase [Steroidobacteraceae bacterium]